MPPTNDTWETIFCKTDYTNISGLIQRINSSKIHTNIISSNNFPDASIIRMGDYARKY